LLCRLALAFPPLYLAITRHGQGGFGIVYKTEKKKEEDIAMEKSSEGR